MGERGPPPTPTNVLERRGSWRAGRNPGEPRPEPGRPRCPRWLSRDAKAAWRHLVPLLDGMGVLARVDAHALVRYCTLWARWRKAIEFLQDREDFYVVKDESGQVKELKPYPQVKMAAQLSEHLLRLEQQLGMTPAARSRIVVPQQDPQHGPDKRRFLKLG